MSYTKTYPNGQILNSSALSPLDTMTIMQIVTLQALGIVVDPKNPDTAYRQVRIGWQKWGAPAWKDGEDTCIITATIEKDNYALVRDQLFAQNDDTSLVQNMSYTRVWKVHFTLYGPNCYVNASAIITAMQLDWAFQFLQTPPPPYVSQLYLIPRFNEPVYIPEDFQGKWWARSTVELAFNELVLENLITPAAASVSIGLITDTGIVESLDVKS